MLDLENFPYSESAKRMLSYLSVDFYDKSYVGKWIFEVMGQEWDNVKSLFDLFYIQAFPDTATWTLPYYEQKFGLDGVGTFEKRRQTLIEKVTITLPFSPYKIVQSAAELTGIDAKNIFVAEYPRQYSFRLSFLVEDNFDVDFGRIKNYLMNVKPAHLLLLMDKMIKTEVIISLTTASKLKIMSDFYPRYNIPPLYFDGSWSLDGTYVLSGYQANQTIDFYPLIMWIKSDIMEKVIPISCMKVESSLEITKAQYEEMMLLRADCPNIISSAVPGWSGNTYLPVAILSESLVSYQMLVAINKDIDIQSTMQSDYKMQVNYTEQAHLCGYWNTKTGIDTSAMWIADVTIPTKMVTNQLLFWNETRPTLLQSSIVKTGCSFAEAVKVDNCSLRIEKDLWFWDGSTKLDGSRSFGADVIDYRL